MKYYLYFALASMAFAWVASADDIRHEVAVVTNPVDDYLSICGWEFDVEGGGYSTCAIDLDGDRLADQMFANAATSGTGGNAATIYLARKDGKFTRIGTLGHGVMATETIKTGGRLMHCFWSFGGGSWSITTYLISHDGLKEIMTTGGERHDERFQKLFDEVFATSFKPDYRFVAARPKPKTGQGGAAKPATPGR
ncbi:hypothetical protein [Brevifollis gellanilyticus]|nr:hypothetical protein [Brevifollis gellanilyticus]